MFHSPVVNLCVGVSWSSTYAESGRSRRTSGGTMYHDLQINRLRALVTVVDLGGFRKAAAALHITQPAVSQQIRQLGTLIKGPVFVSTARQLQLSPQGQELLGY